MKIIEKYLKAVSDKSRLRIIKLLENKPMCVCEFAYVLKTTQPNISKHLKKLKDSGIIDSKQDGFWTEYFINEQDNIRLKAILKNINEFLVNDDIIKSDLRLAGKVDRKDICNS